MSNCQYSIFYTSHPFMRSFRSGDLNLPGAEGTMIECID